jgi:RES domain-containing protein
MLVYRIAKSALRAQDLSGTGSLKFGGRWNSKGTSMLYTSMNSSLAYLENLVHFDESESPPQLYIATIEIKNDENLIFQLPDKNYPPAWEVQDNPENKIIGDQWVRENKFPAFKVRSAINPAEYNFLLNPLYPNFQDKVMITVIQQLKVDARLVK